jgi:D-alanine-D-alanine ligase
VRNADDLSAALRKAFEYGEEVLVQKFVQGRELTVGFLGEVPLPIVEVRAQAGFFDYQAKYKDQKTEYIVPAPLPADLVRVVQAEALKAYQALGCEGFGRVDVILDGAGVPQVLEINTIPGFTAMSLLPKAARAAGLDFQQLCLILIDMAYGKKKAEPAAHKR